MNNNYTNIDKQENTLAGVFGAFLFSLAGGVLWFILYQINFLAAVSGFVGVICAVKGYMLFSKAKKENYALTVTPPRLGGKIKKGVFATRAPFRPNSLGLSSVRLEEIYYDTKRGPVLVVSGADLLDGTPIYDIKPYLPYTDAHPEASGSFAEEHKKDQIEVVFPDELRMRLPENLQEAVLEVLKQDPRAAYNKKPDYVYGMTFGGYDIRFTVEEQVLWVKEVIAITQDGFYKIK